MQPNDFLKITLTDIKVKISEEFDRNFERKAFFDKKWKQPKLINRRGSVMMRTGKLRRSIKSKLTQKGVVFTSAMPYADMLNNGGEIIVTEKMKRFFWAMYYKALGSTTKVYTNQFGGKVKVHNTDKMKKTLKSNSQRATRMKAEAEQWKALALKKVGSKMKIEPRQFIGHHPQIDRAVKEIVNKNLKELEIKPFKK
ncbi:hypothetical protein EDL99_11325 [Ornithobacterium rhinotracheale]|uniref:hypothetical protein n=1 Tax=Ornithobacterium rhinotracheale TaxID=28251 RepID=UPI00129D01BE|nr:hypothetical protein [Ornithobacterium rhinotracheale]MRJ09440.1 hypothetical protein [Ornithobacterium rhinotracheale]UOH77325.1 hypothetical protein MT996_08905 [Ornithobacterium rhinotracheale]